jgi:hypothetical protein
MAGQAPAKRLVRSEKCGAKIHAVCAKGEQRKDQDEEEKNEDASKCFDVNPRSRELANCPSECGH